ncbi:RAMP superfamily CRISPR-associated protein [Sorangium sp. So ce1024]|uniref:RAMP superfamily CRISPR-associated protein n=1 Tax=Sorangium sp. So ce1024 TaxID=3133327 RepID=UPI003EFE2F77
MLNLHFSTPSFVGGAEARSVDRATGLRPPSVRGALRAWFRMGAAAVLLVPGKNSESAERGMVELLHRAESELFGSTAVRSRVIVGPPAGGQVVRLRPDDRRWPGLRYLGYGLFEGTGSEALVTDAAAIAAAMPQPAAVPRELGPVSLPISLRPRGSGDRVTNAHHRLLGATLWLWLHLGGLGARSRRGWGSLRLAQPSPLLQGLPELRAGGAADIVNGLIQGLDRATEVFRDELPNLGIQVPPGDRPHPGLRTIDGIENITVLPGDHPTPIEALEHAGRLFRDFRSTLQRRKLGMPPLPDYFDVKASLQAGRPARSVDRAAFGLPLPFYFRSLNGMKTRFVPQTDDGDRLSSPLLFRVHPVHGRGDRPRYAAVLVNLEDRAAALAGQKLKQDGMTGTVPTPDGRLVRDFIQWALNEAKRIAPGGGRP